MENFEKINNFNYLEYIQDIFKSYDKNPELFEELRNMTEDIEKPNVLKKDCTYFQIENVENIDSYDEYKEKSENLLKKFIQINERINQELKKDWSNNKNKEIIEKLKEKQESIYIEKLTHIKNT